MVLETRLVLEAQLVSESAMALQMHTSLLSADLAVLFAHPPQAQLVSESVMAAVRKRENEHMPELAGVLCRHVDEKHQSTLVVRVQGDGKHGRGGCGGESPV